MKQLEKKLIIDNWFWKVFQTFFENNWKTWNVLTMEKSWKWDWVFIFPLTKDKEIIYINEFKFWPWTKKISFPAWWTEKNDEKYIDKTSIAEKELTEETWYKSNKMIYLWTYFDHSYVLGNVHLFFAFWCEKIKEQNLQDLEEIEVFKVNIETFENMLKNNEVNCPFSELAYVRAKELTNNFTNFDF